VSLRVWPSGSDGVDRHRSSTFVGDSDYGQRLAGISWVADHFHIMSHRNLDSCPITSVVEELYQACDRGHYGGVSSDHAARNVDVKRRCGHPH
jgi:hypothetical protein